MAAAPVHLCAILHGLWGVSSHVGYLGRSLSHQAEIQALQPSKSSSIIGLDQENIKLIVFAPKSNEWTNSYDGIDTSAERTLIEIDAKIKEIEADGGKVVKFSIVGYSLGGLVARYVIGLLASRTPSFFDKIEPVNFTTFASPAIGIPKYDSFWSTVIRYLGARLLSRSGSQLYENDRFLPSSVLEGNQQEVKPEVGFMSKFSFAKEKAEPLLLVMADPRYSFFKALASFERVEIYANAVNDRTVPFPTGAIESHDPFSLAKAQALNVLKLRGVEIEGEPDLKDGGLEIVLQSDDVPIIVSYKTIPLPPPPTAEEISKRPKKNFKFKLPLLLRPTTYPFSRPVSLFIIVFLPLTLPLSVLFLITRFLLQGRDSRSRIKSVRKDLGGGRKGMLQRVGVGLREVMDEVRDEIAQPDNPDNVDSTSNSNTSSTSSSNSSGDEQTPMISPRHPALIPFANSGGTETPPLARPISPSQEVDPEATGSNSKPYPSDPILSKNQKIMIRNLNSIPQLRKHFTYYPKSRNSHGTIVVRDPAFEMHRIGMKVVDHWAKGFLL